MLRSLALVLELLGLLVPKRLLEAVAARLIRTRFYAEASHVLFYRSGRAALSAILARVASARPGAAVLVPEYICNLVPRAVKASGLPVRTYRTDEQFRPVLEELERQVRDGQPAAVLLASLFGSQNCRPEAVERIRRADARAILILDECQNLIRNNGVRLGDGCVAVVSFNLKNVRGSMGGALCFRGDLLGLSRPRWTPAEAMKAECMTVLYHLRQALRLAAGAARGWVRRVLRSDELWPRPGLEYSHCATFPYQLRATPIARISLVAAICEMIRIDSIERRRRRIHAAFGERIAREGFGELIATERADVSPFVPFRLANPSVAGRLPLKGPYAADDDPTRTLRPDVLCFRNDLQHLPIAMGIHRHDP